MDNPTQSLDPFRHRSLRPLVLVAAHAFLWSVWMAGLFSFAPRYENIFRKLNLKLPMTTEIVFSLSHGFLPASLILVLVSLAIDGVVYYRLRRSLARNLWSGLMTVAPLAVISLTVVAICDPAVRVMEALTR